MTRLIGSFTSQRPLLPSSFTNQRPLIVLNLGGQSVAFTILASSKQTIWKASVMNDGRLKIDRLPFSGLSIVALYLDKKQDTLYWSDVDNSAIWRAKMDGTDKEIFMR